MFKIKHTPPEQAEGKLKEHYSIFPPGMDPPVPFQLYTASPDFQAIGVQSLRYFLAHPRLSAPLLAAVRYVTASASGFDYCVAFNTALLCKMGAEEAEVKTLVEDLDKAPFEANEIALLKLVGKVVKAPETVTQADVDACRDAGWLDSDILDACQHAMNLEGTGKLMKAFLA